MTGSPKISTQSPQLLSAALSGTGRQPKVLFIWWMLFCKECFNGFHAWVQIHPSLGEDLLSAAARLLVLVTNRMAGEGQNVHDGGQDSPHKARPASNQPGYRGLCSI